MGLKPNLSLHLLYLTILGEGETYCLSWCFRGEGLLASRPRAHSSHFDLHLRYFPIVVFVFGLDVS